MLASVALRELEEVFVAACLNASQPMDMAAVYRHESEGRLHCEVLVYFSPASSQVANAVGAVPCVKPEPHSLSLLAGSEDAWTTLFPEFNR